MSADLYADYRVVRGLLAGETVARTVEVRPDLRVDVDADGYVVGVERIGDRVTSADLTEALRACIIPREKDQ